MLYGPGVRDGVWMDDDGPRLTAADVRHIAAQEARRVVDHHEDDVRLKNLFCSFDRKKDLEEATGLSFE